MKQWKNKLTAAIAIAMVMAAAVPVNAAMGSKAGLSMPGESSGTNYRALSNSSYNYSYSTGGALGSRGNQELPDDPNYVSNRRFSNAGTTTRLGSRSGMEMPAGSTGTRLGSSRTSNSLGSSRTSNSLGTNRYISSSGSSTGMGARAGTSMPGASTSTSSRLGSSTGSALGTSRYTSSSGSSTGMGSRAGSVMPGSNYSSNYSSNYGSYYNSNASSTSTNRNSSSYGGYNVTLEYPGDDRITGGADWRMSSLLGSLSSNITAVSDSGYVLSGDFSWVSHGNSYRLEESDNGRRFTFRFTPDDSRYNTVTGSIIISW